MYEKLSHYETFVNYVNLVILMRTIYTCANQWCVIDIPRCVIIGICDTRYVSLDCHRYSESFIFFLYEHLLFTNKKCWVEVKISKWWCQSNFRACILGEKQKMYQEDFTIPLLNITDCTLVWTDSKLPQQWLSQMKTCLIMMLRKTSMPNMNPRRSLEGKKN